MTLYSDEIKELVRSCEWPRRLVLDVIEYPEYLGIRLHRNNFESFSSADKKVIAERVGQVIMAIRSKGCPCYMEVVKGDGSYAGQ